MIYTSKLNRLHIDHERPGLILCGNDRSGEWKSMPNEPGGWGRRRRCYPTPRQRARLRLLSDAEQITVGKLLRCPWVDPCPG